jgi:hypothetical protein
MKVKVRHVDCAIPPRSQCLQMRCVGSSQSRFILLGSEKVDGMYRVIFLQELIKVSIKGWLGCGLWTSNLDSLTPYLKTLLLPEY